MRFNIQSLLVLVLTMFVASLGVSIAPAYAIDCRNTPPVVKVLRYQEPTEYVRNFTSVGLTKLHGGSVRLDSPMTLGLGGGPMGLDYSMSYVVKQEGSVSCVQPSLITVDFTIAPSILIARNYESGSCEYEAVLKHEEKHVQALMDFQQLYAPRLQQYILRLTKDRLRARATSNVNVAFEQKQMEQALDSALQDYMSKMASVIQRKQLKIDSADEYARVAAQCSNW